MKLLGLLNHWQVNAIVFLFNLYVFISIPSSETFGRITMLILAGLNFLCAVALYYYQEFGHD